MRAFILASVCMYARVGYAAPPADAPPPELSPPPATAAAAPVPAGSQTPEQLSATIDVALEAWTAGEWTQARELLEPLAASPDTIEDVLDRERAYRYLSDATLLDESMTVESRETLVKGYVSRLLEQDEAWAPPPGRHSEGLYKLTEDLRAARAAEKAAACEANLVACRADYRNEETLHGRLKLKHGKLESELDEKTVIEKTAIRNNRGLALVPFGVAHFMQGRPKMGGGFLAAEAAFGGAGLGLLLWRTFAINCRRTAGFTPGSLVCEGKQNEKRGIAARNAEQAMAFLTLGTIVTDIVVAQILFKPITYETRDDRTKKEIRDEQDGKSLEQLDDEQREDRKQDERSGDDKAQLRPGAMLTEKGAGASLRLRF